VKQGHISPSPAGGSQSSDTANHIQNYETSISRPNYGANIEDDQRGQSLPNATFSENDRPLLSPTRDRAQLDFSFSKTVLENDSGKETIEESAPFYVGMLPLNQNWLYSAINTSSKSYGE
jgi:hypothetical protein